MKDNKGNQNISISQIVSHRQGPEGKGKIILTADQKKKIIRIRRASRLLDYLILILSLLALLIGFYAFWDTHKVMEVADSSSYSVYKPDKMDNLNFADLSKKNPDLIGWIDVYGTNIDYPVVQGKDNDEYLNKTVLGEFSTGGSIFLDASNSKDFTDYQNIIYGHFMAERKMFGDLELFDDKEFFDSHKYGLLHRLGEKSKGIEFFALIKTVGNDMTVLRTAKTIEENPGLIDYIYENSKYSRKLDFTGDDNIVVLDTCDFTITDGRSILVGRLTDNIEENTFRKSSVKENPFQNLITKTSKVNILKILGIFWVILVIIYLIYESIRKKKEDKANVQ